MFFKKVKKSNNEELIKDFDSILSFAKAILISESPHRIYDLIYSLGKPYQFEIINMCIKGKPLSRDLAFDIEHLFLKNGRKNYSFKIITKGEFLNYKDNLKEESLHPSDSLVFAFPWKQSRLIDSFKNIGKKVGDKWEHDISNHRVIRIFPLNIGYVTNGNHSTVMNIIDNESPMIITGELNLAPIYKEIYSDGLYFRRITDNYIVDEVASTEFAAIFEIGRLLCENANFD